MATQQRHKVKRHISLNADVVEDLEADARRTRATLSEVIEARCRMSQQATGQAQAFLDARLEQLVEDLADLRAKVTKIMDILGPLAADQLPEAEEPRPRIATYEEMYGPITRTPPPELVQPPVTPPPRRRWPWSS
jgi:hypothetical protein